MEPSQEKQSPSHLVQTKVSNTQPSLSISSPVLDAAQEKQKILLDQINVPSRLKLYDAVSISLEVELPAVMSDYASPDCAN